VKSPQLPLIAHAICRAVNRGADQNIGISTTKKKKDREKEKKVLQVCEVCVSNALIDWGNELLHVVWAPGAKIRAPTPRKPCAWLHTPLALAEPWSPM
jgi:hypothetical protein